MARGRNPVKEPPLCLNKLNYMKDTPNDQIVQKENAAHSPPLTPEHLAQLRDGSGIAEDVIAERGYRSITQRTTLREFGFSAEQCKHVPGLLIPQFNTDGDNGRYTFKPDTPIEKFDKRKNK